MYDYLIVGSGLFGSTFAYETSKRGKKCLVIDKRNHIGGNIYTKQIEGINVHQYGAHIFHTNDATIWNYINSFSEFNNFINSPIAISQGRVYNLPFNMNTFYSIWGVTTPNEAKTIIQDQIAKLNIGEPTNLEEQALLLVGPDIYYKLIKGYTEKQWGKSATELPAFIIKRIPLRFTFNNNYFNDRYQGIPIGGYTQIIEKMLENVDVKLNTDFFDSYKDFRKIARKLVFTGMIDEFFEYKFGKLEYRSLRFETEIINTSNFQGNAVVNYCDADVPYTRIIEHKHFESESQIELKEQEKTVITREYPKAWEPSDEPYYPVNDSRNNSLYAKYQKMALDFPDVIFGGRLGSYKYYNMDEIISSALTCISQEFGESVKDSSP